MKNWKLFFLLVFFWGVSKANFGSYAETSTFSGLRKNLKATTSSGFIVRSVPFSGQRKILPVYRKFRPKSILVSFEPYFFNSLFLSSLRPLELIGTPTTERIHSSSIARFGTRAPPVAS
jgi:hypothetical protein